MLTIQKLMQMKADAESHWSDAHKNYRAWLKFSHGMKDAQWDPTVLSLRGGRPSQQYNICPGFIRPTVNALKEVPPEIQVHPISNATKQDAQALAGALRAIQYRSNASRAYIYAMECAMRGGLGGWRVLPKKVRGKIEILVQPILDPTSILIDPTCQEMDFSDAKWVMIRMEVGASDYKEDYPKGLAEGIDGKVTIWECWAERVERVPQTGDDGLPMADGLGNVITEERIRVDYYVFDEATAAPLAYQEKYLGTRIPVVLVTGPMALVEGKREIFALTHDIEAMQREINWVKSEQIAQRSAYPKAQGFAEDEAIGDYLDEWENSAVDSVAWLRHKKGTRPPTPFPPPPPATGDIESTRENVEMARQVTGIYPDPTLQQAAGTPSGKAIKLQRMTAGVANYHYVDAINYGMKRTGEILIELVEKYWNDNDIRMALGGDNAAFAVSFGDRQVPDAQNVDLARARFGITISTGPSYASQREERLDRITEFFQGDVEGKALLRDWMLKQTDIPGAEEVAERFVAILPDAVRQVVLKEDSSDPKEQVLQLRIALQKASQREQFAAKMIKTLTEALQKETAELKSKRDELDSRERIARDQQEGDTHRETLRLSSAHLIEDQRAALDLQLQRMEDLTKLLLQQRENESDERLAQRQGARVDVMV